MATPIKSVEDIAHIANISANNDEVIGSDELGCKDTVEPWNTITNRKENKKEKSDRKRQDSDRDDRDRSRGDKRRRSRDRR